MLLQIPNTKSTKGSEFFPGYQKVTLTNYLDKRLNEVKSNVLNGHLHFS